jgi:DNA (cytosine-5)-methyltransferase 1
MKKSFVDFFAGIGLVEIGLESSGWLSLGSIDYSQNKEKVYLSNFPEKPKGHYLVRDIFELDIEEVPKAFLYHASFPCTDVSAAGSREGSQNGRESSEIDSFLRILSELRELRPPLVMLENVKGLITSNKGLDLRFLIQRLNMSGYVTDLLCIDAKHFVPQSRERVFIIGHLENYLAKANVGHPQPDLIQNQFTRSDRQLIKFINNNKDLRWYFHELPPIKNSKSNLKDIIDKNNNEWWPSHRTKYLLDQMYPRHRTWLDEQIDKSDYSYCTVFRRMRLRDGKKQSTAELRTDGIAGCLRTSKGGSAKQILIRSGKGFIKARLLSPLECSRLMGAPDLIFPNDMSTTDALFCLGDAVCVDVIKWIDINYLTPFYRIYSKIKPDAIEVYMPNNKATVELGEETIAEINRLFSAWCKKHNSKQFNMPYKGRVYAALVVINNIVLGQWDISDLHKAVSTDVELFFGERALRNHTERRVKLILSDHDRKGHYVEGGRTSGGTKKAALEFIWLIRDFVEKLNLLNDKEVVDASLIYLTEKLLEIHDKYEMLGGININYNASELISQYISKIINCKVGNPGAVLQHLVGAKLERRFRNTNVKIKHHSSSAADKQTGRHGDFEINTTVFHVTKILNEGHVKKANRNVSNGRDVYILIPMENELHAGLTIKNEKGDAFLKKVQIISIEKFIGQNLDEMAVFDKTSSREELKKLLEVYNELIDNYEGDNSLKVIIPDFGIRKK